MCGLTQSDEELQTLRKIFTKLDTDKNGYITEDEIEVGMADLIGKFSSILGHDPDWKSILRSLDTDKDRRLDYNEFLSAATNRVKLLNDENLRVAFQVLDKNGDGKVSA